MPRIPKHLIAYLTLLGAIIGYFIFLCGSHKPPTPFLTLLIVVFATLGCLLGIVIRLSGGIIWLVRKKVFLFGERPHSENGESGVTTDKMEMNRE